MTETSDRTSAGSLMNDWAKFVKDLEQKGGLGGVVIDTETVTDRSCGGRTKAGTEFYVTWVPDMFLALDMSQDEQALVDAFTKVVEYKPFCRYIDKKRNGCLTFEWDKENPEGRLIVLQKEEGLTDLQRIQ